MQSVITSISEARREDARHLARQFGLRYPELKKKAEDLAEIYCALPDPTNQLESINEGTNFTSFDQALRNVDTLRAIGCEVNESHEFRAIF